MGYAEDIIRRVAAPDQLDGFRGEGERLPGGLERLTQRLCRGRAAGLPDAQVRGEAVRVAARVVICRRGLPQPYLERDEGCGRLRCQKEGCPRRSWVNSARRARVMVNGVISACLWQATIRGSYNQDARTLATEKATLWLQKHSDSSSSERR